MTQDQTLIDALEGLKYLSDNEYETGYSRAVDHAVKTFKQDLPRLLNSPETVERVIKAYWGNDERFAELDEAFKDEMREGMRAAIAEIQRKIGV